ncbi:hypothetical protein B0H67DRAFT_41478 [Lasiosphaeris hirsuta]|uniref:Uncharacterized protein n=1 Tax=Lasiosphaeris hirsuta TaxID=260670 RepID=A0AA40BAJ5_9PEZI|nr:hypothetical protein B0H67DRAFT_41478 [Lasiosphaeris hirsuta]
MASASNQKGYKVRGLRDLEEILTCRGSSLVFKRWWWRRWGLRVGRREGRVWDNEVPTRTCRANNKYHSLARDRDASAAGLWCPCRERVRGATHRQKVTRRVQKNTQSKKYAMHTCLVTRVRSREQRNQAASWDGNELKGGREKGESCFDASKRYKRWPGERDGGTSSQVPLPCKTHHQHWQPRGNVNQATPDWYSTPARVTSEGPSFRTSRARVFRAHMWLDAAVKPHAHPSPATAS